MHVRAPLGNFTQLIYFLKGLRPPGLALPHSPSCPLTLGKADLRGTRGNFTHGSPARTWEKAQGEREEQGTRLHTCISTPSCHRRDLR